MSTSAIVSLGAATTDAARFGGKAAGLGRLIDLGHRVPEGFAVAADALANTLDHLGLTDELEQLDGSMARGEPDLAAAERIHRALLAHPMPSELESKLVRAADELGAGQTLIARSSAAVEDSTAHSYAGMFESIRVGSVADLSAAIRSVWASVFTPRALLYAVASGMNRTPVMAVVVQRFIEAQRSGVMFTTFRRPGGESATLIEHVAGTSEKLVAGEVTPERLWLNAGDETTDPLLESPHANELARLALQLEQQFGLPQDVEWCLLDDQIHLVQSRAITAGFGSAGIEDVAAGPALLTGTGASPGFGCGEVHLAFNIEQALTLESGQVLVTTMTNPDMVVAMRNSVAIVTDVGGMICHAAIVSRELQLPCVVGTGNATEVLVDRQVVTVDGGRGAVLDGEVAVAATMTQVATPNHLWNAWMERHEAGAIPVVSTIDLVASAPESIEELGYLIDADIRTDGNGLWRSFGDDLANLLGDQLTRLESSAPPKVLVHVVTHGGVPQPDLDDALGVRTSPMLAPPGSVPAQVRALTADLSSTDEARTGLANVAETIGRVIDPANNPGPPPQIRQAAMPDLESRMRWWSLLPEYDRYHREFDTVRDSGMYPWIEIRSEVLTSPLLKSLVLPGFELVPRALGFAGMPPMHTKWFRTRFHVRADAFGQTWARLVHATWDSDFMEDFLRRVRLSYVRLGDAVVPFPKSASEAAELTGDEIVDLIRGWWPRWTEFFALCLFIQAQGEGILYPVIEEAVGANLADLGPPPEGARWPATTELMAPTTPVLSGDYMGSLHRVRQALDRANLRSTEQAVAAIDRGHEPQLASIVEDHLRDWHWMRDRDLLFEPWDTANRVIDTAFRTDPHPIVPYADNLVRNRLALSLHADLAAASGRSDALRHGVRFLQDLNVERENHHILWLKYSYPLRTVLLEIERRLVNVDAITPGMVFYLQAPELIEALLGLPAKPAGDLAELARQRRKAYRHESKLEEVDPATLYSEDDYF